MVDEALETEVVEEDSTPETETPPVEETPKEQPKQEWDRERQFRDELAAANRREGELKAQLDAAQKNLTSMQDKKDDGDPVDLDDYDNLKNAVVQLREQFKQSQSDLSSARQQLNRFQSKVVEEEGLRLLNQECDALDKRYGARHRNSVLDQVSKEYAEAGMDSPTVSPAARAAWIRKALRVGYVEANEKNPSKSEPAKTASQTKKAPPPVDTGVGGETPSDEIPEGDYHTVKAAIEARDRRMARGG